MSKEKLYDPKVTVCDQCLRACCWQGEFMCDESYEAGIVDKRIKTLITEDAGEHSDYWNEHLWMANERLLSVSDLKALGVTDKDMLDLKEFSEAQTNE